MRLVPEVVQKLQPVQLVNVDEQFVPVATVTALGLGDVARNQQETTTVYAFGPAVG